MNDLITLDGIMNDLIGRVERNEPVSPSSWVEAALRIEVLASNLDEDLAVMEAKMETDEARLIGEDLTSAKAKTLAKLAINYEDYLKLKAKIKRINSFIITARKRSAIQTM